MNKLLRNIAISYLNKRGYNIGYDKVTGLPKLYWNAVYLNVNDPYYLYYVKCSTRFTIDEVIALASKVIMRAENNRERSYTVIAGDDSKTLSYKEMIEIAQLNCHCFNRSHMWRHALNSDSAFKYDDYAYIVNVRNENLDIVETIHPTTIYKTAQKISDLLLGIDAAYVYSRYVEDKNVFISVEQYHNGVQCSQKVAIDIIYD